VHTTELRRLRDLRETTLYLYRLPEEPFEPDPDGTTGYWVAREPVEPLERVELIDGAQRHAEAGIELRFVRDLLAVWERVAASTLDFSGVRLANAR
jgi:hypothetical protein